MTEVSHYTAAVSSVQIREIGGGGLEDRFRVLAWDKLLLPIAPLAASLMGSLRV